MELLKKIEAKQARLGVIGLGYVGLPLAVEFARAGFAVVGYDVDERKVAELMAGRSYIPDVPSEHLAEVVKNGKFVATTDPKRLGRRRHHRHLRADAAAQDQGPRHDLRRAGGGGRRRRCCARGS